VKLSENPIFITHKRLVHRGGVLAAVLIAGLIGFSLLLGLLNSLSEIKLSGQLHGWGFRSPAETGKNIYGWVIGVEILVLVMLGVNRVTRALQEDRKAGLWDSNRLTPLKPGQIITGYWFAPGLREGYMAAVLAGFGLLVVLFSQLPVTLWLGTQTLIWSTALFCGLLGILFGMAAQKSSGAVIFLAMLMFCPFSFIAPSRMLTNFLFPIYGIANLFQTGDGNRDWTRMPEIFGLPVPPILISLALQAILGLFVWRTLVRKTANPFQPLLLRWEAVALFSMLVGSQHALLWDAWHGKFTAPSEPWRGRELLPIVHGGTLIIGLILLVLASPQPEHVRVESMRLGFKNLGAVFSRSAVSLALSLAGVAGLALLAQFAWGLAASWQAYLVAVLNLAEFLLIFALLLEFCRLRHRRRALGFVALWLFVLCAVPLILAAVFSNEMIARVSLLAPGFMALTNGAESWPQLFLALLAHFCVVVILFFGWRRQWKKLLAHTAG